MRIIASTLISSLGRGKKAHIDALKAGKTGLSESTEFHQHIAPLKTYLGEVKGLNTIKLPEAHKPFECRNNRLAMMALQTDDFETEVIKYRETFGKSRIGLVVGTSTSGIAETENAFIHPDGAENYDYFHSQQMDSLARFSSEYLGIDGPNFVISTACSSSSKVFAVAKRWLDSNLVDAVVVGGVDTLCLTTVHGFNSLGLVSANICKPLDQTRDGINIGEAGGFVLLSNQSLDSSGNKTKAKISVAGIGESSDAFHISTPHPQGLGALNAMRAALKQASIGIDKVRYINLHGTATPSNDLSEVSAISTVLQGKTDPTYISSTKGFTGHTLGAAGITEVIFCQLALEENIVLANLNLSLIDTELNDKFDSSISYLVPRQTKSLDDEDMKFVMTNSFGFGGNNASVVLKKGD